MKVNISGGKVMAKKKINAKFTSTSFFWQFICLHAFVVYDASWTHTLSRAFWYFYQYTQLACYCQVNTVKSDILKLFDSIQKYGTGKFAFTLFTVNVHLNFLNIFARV
jgi:hypothetical protein